MVVDSGMGTGHMAHVNGVDVGGKTGTAQWGAGNSNKEKSRTAAWFTGFAPLDKPQYAFAVVVEGDPGDKSVHGPTSAALIGKMLRQIYKGDKPEKVERKKKHHADDDDDDTPPKDPAADESD